MKTIRTVIETAAVLALCACLVSGCGVVEAESGTASYGKAARFDYERYNENIIGCLIPAMQGGDTRAVVDMLSARLKAEDGIEDKVNGLIAYFPGITDFRLTGDNKDPLQDREAPYVIYITAKAGDGGYYGIEATYVSGDDLGIDRIEAFRLDDASMTALRDDAPTSILTGADKTAGEYVVE